MELYPSNLRPAAGMRGVPQGALVVSVDDDEFIVLRNASNDLSDLAQTLYEKKVRGCRVTVT